MECGSRWLIFIEMKFCWLYDATRSFRMEWKVKHKETKKICSDKNSHCIVIEKVT